MQLQLRTFDTIVASAAAAVQGAAQTALDLTVGSVTRAVLEANAGLGLWMQWLILQVLQTTRAATSTAGDLDSWVADYGLTRLPASTATGTVTFARFAPVTTALVPVGTTVRTSDGSQSFTVTADTTNPAWNAAQNGFTLGRKLIDERAHAAFVVGIGIFQIADFVAHDRVELGGARYRALDPVAHGRNFAPDRLGEGDDLVANKDFWLGQAQRGLGNRARGVAHLHGAPHQDSADKQKQYRAKSAQRMHRPLGLGKMRRRP